MADLPGRPNNDDVNLLSALQKSLEGCQEETKDNNDATGPVIYCSPNKDDDVKQTCRNHTDQGINHSPVEAIQAHSAENLGPASPGDDSTQAEGEETRMCGACCRGFGAHGLIQCPCGDEYCEGCLEYIFDMALDEEDEFPPQCCGIPIPANREWEFVNNDMLHRLDLKTEELSTPNRLYCARSDCGYWIRPEFILPNGLGICNNPRFWDVENQCYKDCLEWTCGLCKTLRHDGSDCPQEEEELNELADREGWQRCHLCQRLVELSYGCNHIMCRCGAEFCYVCGVAWVERGQLGACECELFVGTCLDEDPLGPEDNLGPAVDEFVNDNNVGAPPPLNPPAPGDI